MGDFIFQIKPNFKRLSKTKLKIHLETNAENKIQFLTSFSTEFYLGLKPNR